MSFAEYDHGVLTPLMPAFPEANVPVIQVSLRRDASAAEIRAPGQAPAPLRERSVLVIGSGDTVHNIRALEPEDGTAPDWTRAFDAWIAEGAEKGDVDIRPGAKRSTPLLEMPHAPKGPTPSRLVLPTWPPL